MHVITRPTYEYKMFQIEPIREKLHLIWFNFIFRAK